MVSIRERMLGFVIVGLVRGSSEAQMGLAAWVEGREAAAWDEEERRK